jgi:hypothetical protein
MLQQVTPQQVMPQQQQQQQQQGTVRVMAVHLLLLAPAAMSWQLRR